MNKRESLVVRFKSMSFTGLGLMVILISCPACIPHSRGEDDKIAIESGNSLSAPPLTSIKYVQLLDRQRWLIADSEQLWRTEDAGRSWSQSYSIHSYVEHGKQIRGFSFIDRQTGFLLANGRVLRTGDGGKDWEEVARLGFRAESCYFLDSLNGWAVGAIDQEGWVHNPNIPAYIGVVFSTQDGGRTWKRQLLTIPEGHFDQGTRWSLRDVFFRDTKNGWLVGDGVVFWTEN